MFLGNTYLNALRRATPKAIPAEKITLALGPKMVECCWSDQHEDAQVRFNALKAYCDQIKMPQFAVSFLSAGAVPALYAL